MTSRDELCVLNTGEADAHLELTVYHSDRAPVGPYRMTVDAQRVCHARINDLIDPEAVPLGVPYALLVRSDAPIVAQFLRFDTEASHVAIAMADGHPLRP